MKNPTPRISGTIKQNKVLCKDCEINITGETQFIWNGLPLCFDCWTIKGPNKTQRMILTAIARGSQTTREIQKYVRDNFNTYLYTTRITSNLWILRNDGYIQTESKSETNKQIVKIELIKEVEVLV